MQICVNTSKVVTWFKGLPMYSTDVMSQYHKSLQFFFKGALK